MDGGIGERKVRKGNSATGWSAGGKLERLQRGVALEALGESCSYFWTEEVFRETVSMGTKVGAGIRKHSDASRAWRAT